jgi:hypothetical protein
MRFWIAFFSLLAIASAQETKKITISAENRWANSGLNLNPGDKYSLEVTGRIILQEPGPKRTTTPREVGPDGIARGFRDLLKIFPLNSANRGAVLGRIGDREQSPPFLVGSRKEGQATAPGDLFLNVNLGGNERGEGGYEVTIQITRAAAPAAKPGLTNTPVVEVTQEQLDSLPLRVVDPEGIEGDKVNFLIVGSEAQIVTALQNGGWLQVDRTVKNTIFTAIMVTMSKQAYLTIPMSELMMFGRVQDYGWAHAVPYVVVAERHHFRLWKAPFTVGGRELWVGAGTHDIGFEKDQRNGKITHKIDPNVDKERDWIGQSLVESGMVAKTAYMTPKNAITKAKTAHGGEFFSDGRTLVIYMEPDAATPEAQRFSNLFCSVLAANPDGGEWGDCTQYLEAKPENKQDAGAGLPPLNTNYRVVVVPGIFSSCASDAPAFDTGRSLLKSKYQFDAELLNIPNNSAQDNGQKISDYLRAEWQKDQRPFILIGYSKGAPDIQEALAADPGLRTMVAAFVSVAGASGGSPVADALPEQINGILGKTQGRSGCEGDLAAGLASLSPQVRQEFLRRHPLPYVPTYSLPAVASADRVSKAMLQTWNLMQAYASRHDGQLTEVDAIVPGSTVLGALRADHFAVALPLEKAQGGALRPMLDKNNYPRAALLEAIVRYVLADLER